MISMEVTTKLSIEDAKKKVRSYFGEGGLGLDIVLEDGSCLNFEGAGGFVQTFFCTEEGKTKIDLKAKEWEIQVQNFAKKL